MWYKRNNNDTGPKNINWSCEQKTWVNHPAPFSSGVLGGVLRGKLGGKLGEVLGGKLGGVLGWFPIPRNINLHQTQCLQFLKHELVDSILNIHVHQASIQFWLFIPLLVFLRYLWVLWGTSGYFEVFLSTLGYFEVLLGTLRYFWVLWGISGYFEVLLGTLRYFWVLWGTSG